VSAIDILENQLVGLRHRRCCLVRELNQAKIIVAQIEQKIRDVDSTIADRAMSIQGIMERNKRQSKIKVVK
jgi:hypothetical protein